MQPEIENFVRSKKIALAGMSRSSKKFGNMIAKELIKKGYKIYPVHPSALEIDGLACSPTLTSLAGKVDALLICIPPASVPALLKEAVSIGLNKVWLQQGSWSTEVQQTIEGLNIQAVSKKCVLMYAPPVTSIHRFHRIINAFFGKL